ncbi:MAG TPA: hypothetical protein VJA16_06260 [Thermoanaerobaculia bacterium]
MEAVEAQVAGGGAVLGEGELGQRAGAAGWSGTAVSARSWSVIGGKAAADAAVPAARAKPRLAPGPAAWPL